MPLPLMLFRVLNLFATFLLQNSQDLKLFLHILHMSSLNENRLDSEVFELHVNPFCEHNLHDDVLHCDITELSE